MMAKIMVLWLGLACILILAGCKAVMTETGPGGQAGSCLADDRNMFGEKIPPRVVKLDANKPVTLASGGKVKMEIVVPEESGTVAAYAGKELKTFLEQAFGQPVPLVKAPTGQAFPVILGDCSLACEKGVDVSRIPYDGFTIKIAADAIVIAGPDEKKADLDVYLHPARDFSPKFAKGTWHGVTDFLERFAGVRFYFPGEIGTIVPSLAELKVPAGEVSDRPDKMLREVPYTVGIWYDRTYPNYTNIVANRLAKKIQYARLKMSSRALPFNHGLACRGYIERFATNHPEYFALMPDGSRYCEKHNDPMEPRINQFCYSSGLKEEVFKDAASYLKGESTDVRGVYYREYVRWPTNGIQWVKEWYEDAKHFSYGWEKRYKCFSMMPDDGFYCCRCAACQAAFTNGAKASSTLLWQFTADVARRLKEEGVPGYLAEGAYGIARPLPDVELPDNILVMICPIGPWLENLPELRDKADRNVMDWAAKLGHKVQLWNYAINLVGEGSAFLETTEVIPHMTPRAIGSYYKRMAPVSDGAFMETYGRYYLYNYLNVYVFARVHWDSSVDVDALLDEHYRLMFGAAAPVMKKYYGELEEIWLTKISGNVIETALGPKQVIPSPDVIWGEIISPEQLKKYDGYFDEAERLAAADAMSLKRVKFMRAELFGRMQEYSRDFMEKKRKYMEERLAAKQVMGNMSLLALKTGAAPVVLDGQADEAFWQQAPAAWLMPFANKNVPGLQGVFKTAFDATNVYVAFQLAEPDMAHVTAPGMTLPENAYADNSVEIFLNPSGDFERYTQVMITSAGILGVRKGIVDQRTWHMSGKLVASAARASVWRDEKGWGGELVVPRSELGEMNTGGFPANFCRNRVVAGKPAEYYSWSRLLEKGFHEIVNWGMVYMESDAVRPLARDGYFAGTVGPHGSGDWSFVPGTGAVVEVADSVFPKALKISSSGEGFTSAMQEVAGMKPETRYVLSFMVKTELGSGGATGFIFDGKRTYWLPGDKKHEELSGITAWKQKYYVFKTDAGGDRYSIRLGILGGTGSAWFQNVSLIELPGDLLPRAE